MQAIVISTPGPAEVLVLAERPAPVAGPGEVLIEVRAAGINRADVAQRAGHYPPPPGASPNIPGLEVAGIVAGCGPNVSRWKTGDRVCALLAGGGYAGYVSAPANQCLPVPNGLDFVAAAALPEATFTVWNNVFQRGRLVAGERLLVHGGSSGIGLAAVQLAHLRGSQVVVTVGSEDKARACRELGAERALLYKSEDFEMALAGAGVDVILDMVGGDYVAKNLRILRPEGRLVLINSSAGAKVELNAQLVMAKRLTLTGSTLRSRDNAFKAALAAEVEREVWPLVESGKFRPNVFQTFPLAQAAAAHRLMESSEHIGKIVLRVDAPSTRTI